MPQRVIAVANQKGGVGKSTTTQNLGFALAERGSRVLLVDLDPQSALSVMCGMPYEGGRASLGDCLLGDADVGAVIVRPRPQVWLLPASVSLAAFESSAANDPEARHRLREVLGGLDGGFDYVVVDSPPNLGLLTVNALAAAESVIVPLQVEFLALNGMKALFATVDTVRERLNPELRILGILGTMLRARALHSAEVLDRVRERFGDLVFATVVRQSVRFCEATAGGISILEYDSASPGAEAYRELAMEVERRAQAN
jgi:chromosome partitioning protein